MRPGEHNIDVNSYRGSLYTKEPLPPGAPEAAAKPPAAAPSAEALTRALQKQNEGRGTSNTEKRMLSDLRRGRIGVDHFGQIHSTPTKTPTPAIPLKLKIEDVDGLAGKLRQVEQSAVAAATAGAAVIQALIASGATFVEKTGCDSGTPYTYWAPEWTSDPTP